MRNLPDHPHLDHLRQQAKDLLAGLRETDPAATLAGAQAALARQYGFRTWAELKAEAERQRGRAETADPTLAHEIADRYGLGEVAAGGMRSAAREDEIGRRWTLATERGRFAVQSLDNWVAIVDVETEVALQQAAAAAGVRLPAPVRSRGGAIIESVAGHRWRVHEWVEAGPPLAAPVSAAAAYQVGEILAAVHGLGMPADRISPWHAARLSSESWAALAAQARARRMSWAEDLAAAASTLEELAAAGAGAAGGTGATAPPVLCHNALGPAQARRGSNGRLIIVGWEHAGGQPPAWELADVLWHWSVNPDGGINVAAVRGILAGYRARAGSRPRLELASFRGAMTSLLNYADGQIGLALEARDPEDRRHWERSVRHLLAHLPSRDTLERLLEVASAEAKVAG